MIAYIIVESHTPIVITSQIHLNIGYNTSSGLYAISQEPIHFSFYKQAHQHCVATTETSATLLARAPASFSIQANLA